MANYPYKKVGVQLDKIRNDVNENFVAVENDFKEAKVTNNNLQTQVNTLVVSGDSSPQAQQASVGADGTNYNGNLKARLDSEYNNVTAQLATKIPQINYDADRTYFEARLNALTSGFGQTYTSLEDLQNAHPINDGLNHFVSDDNAWYFWLEDFGWTAGGDLNTVGLADDSVKNSQLDNNLKQLFKLSASNIDNCLLGYIDTTDGSEKTSTTRARTGVFDFKSGDKVYCSELYKFYIVEVDSSGNYLGTLFNFGVNYTFTKSCFARIVIAYQDNSVISDINTLAYQINLLSADKFNYSNKKIDELIADKVNPLSSDLISNIVTCSIGSINTTDGSSVDSTTRARTEELLHFKEGDKFYCTNSYKFYLVEYLEDGTFVGVLYNFGINYTFTTDKYVKIVLAFNDNRTITDLSTLTNQFICVSPSNFNFSNQKIISLINQKPLTNKKWVVFGDSTTDSLVHTAFKYHYWVSQDTGITIVDFGKSGTGYKRTEENNTAFYQRAPSVPTDADIVTLFGLGNDCSQNYTVGTINDTDESTWCGAVNKTINIILERCPNCNIALVTPYQWGIYPTNTDNKMKELSQKLKEIADNRGLEFLDLYKRSSVRPNDVTFNSTYFYNGDRVHLNELGHKKFLYPKFKQLILGMTNKLS